MKQTSFTVKNLGGNIPKKQSIIMKRSFRSSIKPLSLDSTILVDELTAKAFYHFRTFELFNIWTPPFLCTNPSTQLTNCEDPSTQLQSLTREDCWLQSSSVHPDNDDQENAWSQNPMVYIHSNFFTREMN